MEDDIIRRLAERLERLARRLDREWGTNVLPDPPTSHRANKDVLVIGEALWCYDDLGPYLGNKIRVEDLREWNVGAERGEN